MALKPCRECGKQVSSDASKCPHCGTPHPTSQFSKGARGCLWLIGIVFALGMLSTLLPDAADDPAASQQPAPQVSAVNPAVTTFLSTHPEFGQVQYVEALPNWAKGERQRVTTTAGSFLFYLQTGDVVTVYKLDGGGRNEVYRSDKPDEPLPNVSRAQTSELPAYEVVERMRQMNGRMYGDVVVTSWSRDKPTEESEALLRAIMARESLEDAGLYCSKPAIRAAASVSYANANPSAKKCIIGSFSAGRFLPASD